jgi:dCTP diphosphatase
VTKDTHTTLFYLREKVAEFVAARNWQPFHNPKNLAMSISIEAAELQEHFQWLTIEESRVYLHSLEQRLDVADELADIVIYCLSFANTAEIDVSDAVLKKLARNEHRFPPPESS